MNQLAALLDDLDMEITADGRNLLNLQISMSIKEPISPNNLLTTPNLDRLCDEILTFLQIDIGDGDLNS